ncbi:MAG TPA: phage holin family protein [Clostridia bacterium]|jgi:uncharacterized membrane protein YvlD (DUF360 family)|nr:phage holin family protein [Clostridia bacterium]
MVRTVIRFIISAIVLLVVSLFIPGFEIVGFFNALIAAVVIAALGYLAQLAFGKDASPQSRGIVSFIVAALVIYIAQWFVPTMRVNIWGAALAALVIGLVDALVPTTIR